MFFLFKVEGRCLFFGLKKGCLAYLGAKSKLFLFLILLILNKKTSEMVSKHVFWTL